MADPLVTLSARLAPAFAAVAAAAAAGSDLPAEPAEPAEPAVRRSDRADYQADGALALAKRLGRPPRDVAHEVVERADLDDVAVAEIAGPGFVNLTLTPDFLSRQLAEMLDDDRLGVRPDVSPEIVVVDYSAPNVAKEMHVGHLRSTIIGDALVRTLAFLGHHPIRQNHLGDWGTPFGMLVEHLCDEGEQHAVEELGVGDLNAFYQEARRKFDSDADFRDRSRNRVVLLQQGDRESLRLWRVLVEQSARYFERVYDRLQVTLTPADNRGESSYNDLLDDVAAELAGKGLLVESEGADVVFPPGFKNKDGDPLPFIVRKSDGGYGYQATDLAALRHRTRDLGATRLLYVVGLPQRDHLEMLFAVGRMAGWLEPPARAEHVTFGSVLGGDRKMLRTRAGASIKLTDLLDEAVERAEAAVAEKNPDLDEATRKQVARAVGIGAVKYADLSNDRVKDYVFDWDRMLAFEGNTAPYLQYAHARIRSIFRRGEIDEGDLAGAALHIEAPEERALAMQLLGFEHAVRLTAEKLQPHRLATYLFDLASAFTHFYESCPVLRAADDATRQSRLALSLLTARVLHDGLALLGIDTPERM